MLAENQIKTEEDKITTLIKILNSHTYNINICESACNSLSFMLNNKRKKEIHLIIRNLKYVNRYQPK